MGLEVEAHVVLLPKQVVSPEYRWLGTQVLPRRNPTGGQGPK
jgi:hypothetical protein